MRAIRGGNYDEHPEPASQNVTLSQIAQMSMDDDFCIRLAHDHYPETETVKAKTMRGPAWTVGAPQAIASTTRSSPENSSFVGGFRLAADGGDDDEPTS